MAVATLDKRRTKPNKATPPIDWREMAIDRNADDAKLASDYAPPIDMATVKEAAGMPAPSPKPFIMPRTTPEQIVAERPQEKLYAPLAPRDLVAPVIEEGLRSENPGVRRLASRSPLQAEAEGISPSLKSYNEAVHAFPTEEQYLDENRPEGFWNRLWSGVKTFGKGTLLTGNPLGGLVGATMSAFDPDTEAKLTYRNWEEPRENARQGRLLDRANREIGINNVMEDNQRQGQQMTDTRNYHNQLLQRDDLRREQDQFNKDRAYDFNTQEYKFKVAQYIADMKRKIEDAKTNAEKEGYTRMYNAAKMHIDYGVPLPPGIARSINAPNLAGQVKPLTDRDTPQWVAEAEAANPGLYGVKDWKDLVDNPEYAQAYRQALEVAKAYMKPGETPEQTLNTLIAGGIMRPLPPAKIPAYEMAKQNPYPIKQQALSARRRPAQGGSAPAKSKTKKEMKAADFEEAVQKKFGGNREAALAEAQRLGWTIK
jgi:hypothetical protein